MSAENKKTLLVDLGVRVPPSIKERVQLAKLSLGRGATVQAIVTEILDEKLPRLRIAESRRLHSGEGRR